MSEGTVVVTFHAPFYDLTGVRRVEIALTEPTSGIALLHQLCERYPRLAPYLVEGQSHEDSLLLVINGKAGPREDVVRPGDRVAIFAQVSGG